MINGKPLNVNKTMVASGAAYVYRAYMTDDNYLLHENKAREEKRGLWGLPDEQRLQPWLFRDAKRQARLPKKNVPLNIIPSENRENEETIYIYNQKTKRSVSDNFQCLDKYFCADMDSCEQAYFYLQKCGLARLDGDGDGIPCEKICTSAPR
jgi:hypothetical protein